MNVIEEHIQELQPMCKSKALKRDIETIGELLFEQIDHTILIHMMCLIVENENEIIDMLGECEHRHSEHIPQEDDTNVREDVICLDCGMSIIEQLKENK